MIVAPHARGSYSEVLRGLMEFPSFFINERLARKQNDWQHSCYRLNYD